MGYNYYIITLAKLNDNFMFVFCHEQITVELYKNPTLGISITGGINGENLCYPGDPSLYVYNMADGKPAKLSGQIQIRDKILSVSDDAVYLWHPAVHT